MLKIPISIIQKCNKTTGLPITLKGESERELFCLHLLSIFEAALRAQKYQILILEDAVQKMVVSEIHGLIHTYERSNFPGNIAR